MIRPTTLPVLAVVTLAACGDASSETDLHGTEVVDSAGVRIVRADTARATRWRTEAEPTWSFAEVVVAGTPVPLSGVLDLVRLDDGTLVLAEASTGSLLFGTPGGEWRRVGRRGDGPEEFSRLERLATSAADRVHGFDETRLRVLGYDVEGDRIGEPTTLPRLANAVRGLAPAEDGWIVAFSYAPIDMTDAEGVLEGTLAIVHAGESGIDTIATLPGQDVFIVPGYRGSPILSGIPYAAPASDGMWYAYGHVPQVSRWARDEGLVVRTRWSPDPDESVLAQAQEARDSLLARAEGMGVPLPQAREMLAVMPDGRDVIRLADLLPTPAGGVWVGPYIMKVGILDDLHRDPRDPWIAVRADGSVQALVTLPERFSPLWVGDDYVIGVLRDPFGVEYVERRELRTSTGPGR